MLTLTLDELEVNAVRAALDERIKILGRTYADLKEQRDSPSNRFALDTVDLAIRQATRAALTIDRALADDYPDDMTLDDLDGWAPGEVTQVFGR